MRRVGRRTRRLIARAGTEQAVRVSVASLFEIAALHTAGRLRLSRPPEQWIRESLELPGVRLLDVAATAAIDAGFTPRSALPDPLDRLLVASARQVDATFVTGDSDVLAYAARTRSVRVHDIST